MSTKSIIVALYRVGCFKTGNFTLKSGKKSNFYIDLRVLVQHPKLLDCVARLISDAILSDEDYDKNVSICGLPYGGIPMATLVARVLSVPQVIVRKEKKRYGTCKQIEGIDCLDEACKVIIIDDIITSGTSINEFADIFKKEAPNVELFKRAFVFIDREEEKFDMKVVPKAVFTLSEIKSILEQSKGRKFKQLSFGERAKKANNKITKRLFEIIEKKKTNLVVSIDDVLVELIPDLVEKIGKHVCAIKFHSDAWELGDDNLWCIKKINDLSLEHNFMLFEDRKFADIGNTVEKQFNRISDNYERLDLVTVLPVFGEGTLKCIKDSAKSSVGMMIVSEVSTRDNLLDARYTEQCVEMGKMYSDSVVGFICQKRVDNDDGFVYMTPGVKINSNGDDKDQRYREPKEAIIRDNCDVIIVGRGITQSDNPEEAAVIYARESFESYLNKFE